MISLARSSADSALGSRLAIRDIEFLTFDCYGTLIDWETGILTTLRPLLLSNGVEVDDETVLETYAALESEAQRGSYRSYRSILRQVMSGIASRFGFRLGGADGDALVRSVSSWPAFPDARPVLGELSSRFKLVILSNIDDDLFQAANEELGRPFHRVFTAEQIGSYKPEARNFEHLLDALGREPARLLHVAQSLYHDILPANRAGIDTIWINRRSRKGGFGATPPARAVPTAEFPDLDSFADALRQAPI
jgi:2-haloacid dehalogenase